MEAIAADGTRFRLTVPADALLQETVVTMTPIAAIEGLPVSGGTVAAVDLAPDGLEFYRPAKLVVTPPGGGAVDAVSFASREGAELHLYPLTLDPTTLTFQLFHFSEYTAYFGEPGTRIVLKAPPHHFVPTSWEDQYRHWIQQLIQKERQAALENRPGDPEFEMKLKQLFVDYYNKVIGPLLPRIEADCSFAKANVGKVIGFARTVDLVIGEDFAVMSETILTSTGKGVENCFREAVEPCLNYADAEQVEQAISAARQAQLLGGDPDVYNPFKPEYACQEASGTLTWSRLRTVEREGRVEREEESATFTLKFGIIPDGGYDLGSSWNYASRGTVSIEIRACGNNTGTDWFTRTWNGSSSGTFARTFTPGVPGVYLHRESPSSSFYTLGSFALPVHRAHSYETCQGDGKVTKTYEDDITKHPRCEGTADGVTRNFVGELKPGSVGGHYIEFNCSKESIFAGGETWRDTLSGRLYLP